MAKPSSPPSAPDRIRILVDGVTPLSFVTPPLTDADGAVLVGRTCDACIAGANGDPVHATLRTYAKSRGDGTYLVELTARAMWLHLVTPRQPVDIVVRVRGFAPIAIAAVVDRVEAPAT